jgi:hypothetical protein
MYRRCGTLALFAAALFAAAFFAIVASRNAAAIELRPTGWNKRCASATKNYVTK